MGTEFNQVPITGLSKHYNKFQDFKGGGCTKYSKEVLQHGADT
jgi:hypothetical protein